VCGNGLGAIDSEENLGLVERVDESVVQELAGILLLCQNVEDKLAGVDVLDEGQIANDDRVRGGELNSLKHVHRVASEGLFTNASQLLSVGHDGARGLEIINSSLSKYNWWDEWREKWVEQWIEHANTKT